MTNNYNATNALMLLFKTPEMMNKLIQNQKLSANWSSCGKFTKIWAQITEDEQPDDTMAELELNDNLRRVVLSRRNNPYHLLAKTSDLKIKSEIPIAASKKPLIAFFDR